MKLLLATVVYAFGALGIAIFIATWVYAENADHWPGVVIATATGIAGFLVGVPLIIIGGFALIITVHETYPGLLRRIWLGGLEDMAEAREEVRS